MQDTLNRITISKVEPPLAKLNRLEGEVEDLETKRIMEEMQMESCTHIKKREKETLECQKRKINEANKDLSTLEGSIK